MKGLDLGQSVQVIANVGVLAGILFLAYEIRQDGLATQLATATNQESGVAARELFIAGNPKFAEILVRAREGGSLDETELFRVNIFYRGVMRNWQTTHYLYLTGGLDEKLWDAQVQGFKTTFAEDAGLRNHWRNNKHRQTPEFNDMASSWVEE